MQPLLNVEQKSNEGQVTKVLRCCAVASSALAVSWWLATTSTQSAFYGTVSRLSHGSQSSHVVSPALHQAAALPGFAWPREMPRGVPPSYTRQLSETRRSAGAAVAAPAAPGLLAQLLALSAGVKAFVVVVAVLVVSLVVRAITGGDAPRQVQLYAASPSAVASVAKSPEKAPSPPKPVVAATPVAAPKPVPVPVEVVVDPAPVAAAAASHGSSPRWPGSAPAAAADRLVPETPVAAAPKAVPERKAPVKKPPLLEMMPKTSWPLPEIKLFGYPHTEVTSRVDAAALAEQAQVRELLTASLVAAGFLGLIIH